MRVVLYAWFSTLNGQNPETQLIRERISAGVQRRKLEGYTLGRALLSVDRETLVLDVFWNGHHCFKEAVE